MWMYGIVFLASFLVDVLPFIGLPAWTVMVFLQIKFDLDIWWVLAVGVTGSTLGRYLLHLYIPHVSSKILKPKKNKDFQFLGKKFDNNIWKSQLFVLLYTLTPLPTTPLFTATGMARLNPLYIIPTFFIGKFTSDAIMVIGGKYAAENVASLTQGLLSWKTISGILVGLILLFALLFVDWRTLFEKNKFTLKFRIWK